MMKKITSKKSIVPISTKVILDSISDGVFTVDCQWLITSFNRSAEEITGVARRQAIGRRCSEVFRSSMCESDCALKKTLATGKPLIGKSGYIVRPDGDRIPISVSTAVLRNAGGMVVGGAETFRDLSELETLRQELAAKFHLGELVTRSPLMQKVFEVLPAIATSPSTVLILGETGTGKGLVARTIHALSRRSQEPFVAVNCGALPDTLLESELFGYKKGAFTGAIKDKPGRFAMAKGGTLFLDEISEITPALQVRLLRVLQDHQYEPLGGIRSEKADVRVIVASNKDLMAEVKKGSFREDLYYRINVVRVELPPLRSRTQDIPILVEQFIARFNRLQGRSVKGITPEALSLLMVHNWSGNVRELENAIERSFILCTDKWISIEHLPEDLNRHSTAEAVDSTLKTSRVLVEDQLIRSALERNQFHRLQTAKELGIHKSTFFRKLKKLGIVAPKETHRSCPASKK